LTVRFTEEFKTARSSVVAGPIEAACRIIWPVSTVLEI
jgi:hypothetical protein